MRSNLASRLVVFAISCLSVLSGTNARAQILPRLRSDGYHTKGPIIPLSAVAPSSAAVYEGYFDSAACDTIYGWAWDKNQPNTAINVDIFDGTNFLQTLTAGDFRPDLPGNKNHGFTYVTPGSLKNGSAHLIHIKFSGTSTELTNSPRSLTCAAPAPTISGYSWNTTPADHQNFGGTVTGTGFVVSGTRVFFCDTGNGSCYEHPSAGITVTSSTNLSLSNVNLGAATYQFYVQTSAGASGRSSSFIVQGGPAVPTISGYSWTTTPADHQNFGGTVTGTGFVVSGTRVFFCDTGNGSCYEHPSAGITVTSSTNLSLSNVNLGTATYQFYVQTSAGASARSSSFTVQSAANAPTISNYSWTMTPTDHQNFGGTVTGTGFVVGSTRVFFCDTNSGSCYEHPSAGITVTNSSNLTLSNVNLGAGTYQFYVQTSAGASARSLSFSVQPGQGAPTITGYSWNTTPADHQNFGGTITGTGFIAGIRVFFCVTGTSTCYEHPSAGITLISSTSLSLNNVNLGSASWQVYVQTSAGPSARSTSFIVASAGLPTITSYSWNTSPVDHQNFSGTITGSGFILGIRVFFCVNGTSTCYEHPQAGVLLNNSNSVSLSNVNLGTGSYQIYVQTSSGVSSRSASFSVVASTTTQPALIVDPGTGPPGSQFRFTGGNFTHNSTATLTVTRPDNSSGGGGRYSSDSNGTVSFVINSQPGDPLGQWKFVLTDDSGKSANVTVQYTSTQQSGTDSMYYTDSTVDVNFPDNAQVTGGSNFTKTWHFQNNGTSTWSSYTAVFISSPNNGNPSINLNAFGATSVSVPQTAPGQTINFSISMKAPTPGTYYSYWQLKNTSGGTFGKQFYVKIRVVAKQGNSLGFGTQSGKSGTKDSVPAKSDRNADPVDTATGNYNYATTDLHVPGRGLDVELSRSYNSQDGIVGPLGAGWSHSFNIFLMNVSSTGASVHYSDGKVLDYINQPGTSNFVSSYPGYYDLLVQNGDGTWTLKKTDQRNYVFDGSGRLATITDRNNNQLSLSYSGGSLSQVTDSVGRTFNFIYSGSLLTGITDPIGRSLQFNYDANLNLISFRDANGNTNSYAYDSNHQLTKIVDGRGNNLVVNSYTNNCPAGIASCVATQTNGRGNQWTFTYNSDGSTSVFDPFNKESRYVQDVNFNIQKTQDRNANTQFASGPANLLYDENNNRVQTADAKGNYAAYVYDQNGNITSRTDPTLNSRQATYDSKNHPVQLMDEFGKPTQMSYDGNGNLTKVTDALSNSSSTTYDSFGEPLVTTDANGNVTTRTYDAQGNLISVKDTLNNTTSYTYDAVGRRITMTGARNGTTKYTYDANDNLLTITDALSNVTTYTYDANNNRTSMLDPRGNSTTYAYDENNSLIKEIDAKSNFLQHSYDKLDRRISTRDKRGNVTNFTYDNEGRLLTVTDPATNTTSYIYDANGNRTQVTDAKGQSTQFTYDAMNRVTKIQDSLGNTILKEYDKAGRPSKETDPRGNATQFNYDDVGNLTKVTDAAAGTAIYTYDKNRNRITQTDPNAHTSNLAYDKLNRLLSTTDPLNHTASYTYDELGNRSSQTDAKGQITRYAYDADNRLSVITYPDNSTVQFTRDANGTVTKMVDSLGTSNYVYDELNRLTSYADPFGKTIGYQYDENGNITKLTYPDGKQVSYQFDANNRMISLTDWAGKATSFQYDSTNLLTTVTYPNGIVTSMTYDNAGRLTAKSDSGISSYNFTLDKNGNRTSASISQPLANRLQNASQNYGYDAANRIQNAGNTTFGFDNNGNLTSKTESGATTNYGYDFENRLVSVGGSSQYFYDGLGTRLQKIEGTQTTRYVVDSNHDLSQVLCETDASGAITAYYVYGLGLVYKVAPDGAHYYYAFDPIGSTIAMTDDAKNVVNSYDYDPFGKLTNSVEGTSNPFQFVGQLGVSVDANGLYFMRARYYSSEAGRFLQSDPVSEFKNAQSLNRYVYVANRPIGSVDPKGLFLKEWGHILEGFAGQVSGAVNYTVITVGQQAVGLVDSGIDALGGFIADTGATNYGGLLYNKTGWVDSRIITSSRQGIQQLDQRLEQVREMAAYVYLYYTAQLGNNPVSNAQLQCQAKMTVRVSDVVTFLAGLATGDLKDLGVPPQDISGALKQGLDALKTTNDARSSAKDLLNLLEKGSCKCP